MKELEMALSFVVLSAVMCLLAFRITAGERFHVDKK